MDKNKSHLATIIVLLVILACSSLGCEKAPGRDNPEPTVDSEQATQEWQAVKQAVDTMFGEIKPPIEDIREDSRIDWDNCANNASVYTANMTGETSINGERPLIAIDPTAGGTAAVLPVSHYLGKDRTEWTYWIDFRGSVHLAE